MFAKQRLESVYSPPDDGIMELSLMMSRRQFNALEQRAMTEGLSIAQFLRRLVNEAVAEEFPCGSPN